MIHEPAKLTPDHGPNGAADLSKNCSNPGDFSDRYHTPGTCNVQWVNRLSAPVSQWLGFQESSRRKWIMTYYLTYNNLHPQDQSENDPTKSINQNKPFLITTIPKCLKVLMCIMLCQQHMERMYIPVAEAKQIDDGSLHPQSAIDKQKSHCWMLYDKTITSSCSHQAKRGLPQFHLDIFDACPLVIQRSY